MNLTANFTLSELTVSEVAARNGLDNTPNGAVIENLKRLAALLEQIRSLLGCPVIVHSGYRSTAVNKAVGGSSTSAHCDGRAADFIAPAFGTPQEIAKVIKNAGIVFDQLIYEGTWVHIAVPRADEQPRQQVLTAHFSGGPATYTEGIA